jgi:hypothetical protein
MDYVLEDMEVMRKELQTWRAESTTHETGLRDEKR